MSRKDIRKPVKALLISGLIYQAMIPQEEILDRLTATFGPLLELSDVVPFSWTDYYQREMGKDLLRCFVAFKRLVAQDQLPEIKHIGMDLEDLWSKNGNRRVNIDPGILTMERVVLATTKNYTHRIYLGNGIYGDLTLIYKKGGYNPLPWTYPDYASQLALDFFGSVRRLYANILKGKGS